MNINDLPDEVLVRILSYLPRSDRLESALTCRRWALAVARAPPLLRDIWLELRQDRREKAEIVFANSRRQYENLRISGAWLLDHKAAFWGNVGPGLRKLMIDGCSWSSNVLYSILQTCSNLESLEIRENCRRIMTVCTWFKLPSGKNLEKIQKSMRNLRHLQLEVIVKADMLEYLFILMPNLSSIGLFCFIRNSNSLRRLPSLLGTGRRITMFVLLVSSDDCEQFLSMSSPSLQTLRWDMNMDGILTPKTFDALRNCSMLRDLRLYYFDDVRPLLNILRNLPELESLYIYCGWQKTQYTREDLMPIFDLRNLRKLSFELCCPDPYVPVEIVDDLSRMTALESLTLGRALGMVDNARFRILASMPNLRELKIDCVKWDAECFRIVLFDLNEKLETLAIYESDRDVWFNWHSELLRNISTILERFRSDRQGDQEFSSLEVLETKGIPLNDACLGLISARHSRLKNVSFTRCYHITCAGLQNLFWHAPLLEELEISVLDNRNGTFFGERCRRLRSLKVQARNNISSQFMSEFESQMPSVKLMFFKSAKFE